MYTKETTKIAASHKTNDLQQDFQRVKDRANETREAIRQTAYDAKQKANEYIAKSLRDVKAKQTEVQDSVVTYVQQNPVKAIGYAMLTGLIAAQLLRK